VESGRPQLVIAHKLDQPAYAAGRSA